MSVVKESMVVAILCLCAHRAKFHRDCASKAPPSCGLTDELVDKILSSISKDNGLLFCQFCLLLQTYSNRMACDLDTFCNFSLPGSPVRVLGL